MKIEEVQSTTKKQRVATHTHIKVRAPRCYTRHSLPGEMWTADGFAALRA